MGKIALCAAMVSLALVSALLGGCVRDETRLMATTCETLLAQDSRSEIDAFLRDAEARLRTLETPPGNIGKLMRDLQDPEAMTHKPALEFCLARLKLHHKARSFD